jgi:flagellar M-ring protein FliF
MTADQSTTAMVGGGVAGARGNEPPAALDPAAPAVAQTAAAGPGSSRNAETTTYEVSRTTRHTLQPSGEVARLSVAVILDDDQVLQAEEDGPSTLARTPRTPEEIQKIQGLVAAAVGLEPDRGDMLTVENVSFDEPVFIEAPPAPFIERYSPQLWEGGRILTVGLIALVAFFMFVRPVMRRLGLQPAPAVALAAAGQMVMPAAGRGPRTVAEMESEIEGQLDALTAQYAEDRRLPVLTRRVSAVTVNEPESVAKLLRGWIADQER